MCNMDGWMVKEYTEFKPGDHVQVIPELVSAWLSLCNRDGKKPIEAIAASLRLRMERYGVKFSPETCIKYGLNKN